MVHQREAMYEHEVVTEFEIGKFVCPVTKSLVPLIAHRPWTLLDWPVTVKACPNCGGEHVVTLDELRHPPLFGYE
jgi:hypothetical protein